MELGGCGLCFVFDLDRSIGILSQVLSLFALVDSAKLLLTVTYKCYFLDLYVLNTLVVWHRKCCGNMWCGCGLGLGLPYCTSSEQLVLVREPAASIWPTLALLLTLVALLTSLDKIFSYRQ